MIDESIVWQQIQILSPLFCLRLATCYTPIAREALTPLGELHTKSFCQKLSVQKLQVLRFLFCSYKSSKQTNEFSTFFSLHTQIKQSFDLFIYYYLFYFYIHTQTQVQFFYNLLISQS